MKTTKEIADMLDGAEYGRKFPGSEPVMLAATNGIVICYGASDDLVEFDGAFCDETGGPGDVYLSPTGLLAHLCSNDDCPHEAAARKTAPRIRALWCEGPDATWTFKTTIPHETFRVMEDGEVFCIGIVFRLVDVPSGAPA